jgi:hypothetical protein
MRRPLFMITRHTFISRLLLRAGVQERADSMSSWRHEIHDFQTRNFLNVTAKGCA